MNTKNQIHKKQQREVVVSGQDDQVNGIQKEIPFHPTEEKSILESLTLTNQKRQYGKRKTETDNSPRKFSDAKKENIDQRIDNGKYHTDQCRVDVNRSCFSFSVT